MGKLQDIYLHSLNLPQLSVCKVTFHKGKSPPSTSSCSQARREGGCCPTRSPRLIYICLSWGFGNPNSKRRGNTAEADKTKPTVHMLVYPTYCFQLKLLSVLHMGKHHRT